MCIILRAVMNIYIELGDREEYSGELRLENSEFGSLDEPHLTYGCALSKKDDEYYIDLDYSIEMDLPCSRCLRPSHYEDGGSIAIRCSQQVLDDDGDEYVLRIVKGKVDILDAVLQDIRLNMPFAPLCSSGCEGICSSCGTYRPCGCKTETNGPFSILKDYFNKSREE